MKVNLHTKKLIIPILMTMMTMAITQGGPAFADSSISLSITNPGAEVYLNAQVGNGMFGKTDPDDRLTISISTGNNTGYTLSIAGADNSGRLTGINTGEYLSSITSAIAETTFKANSEAARQYNNRWGFSPNKYQDTVTGDIITNSTTDAMYLPSPINTTPTVIDITDSANTEAATYALAIGARADTNTTKDSYTANFMILASANATNYSIGFVDATNSMPGALAGGTNDSQVQLPNEVPTKPFHAFVGWCSKLTTSSTCTGTTYQPGQMYDLSNGPITNLYAMWEEVTLSMQNVSTWGSTLTTDVAVRAYDARDGKVYYVTKLQDGHIWMTQNLDFDISQSRTLTSKDTDLTSYNVGGYTSTYGYSQDANGVISWTPVRSTVNAGSMTITNSTYSFSGWNNDYNTPYSVDVGERYVDGNTWYDSNSDCKDANGNNAEDGYNCENHFRKAPYATNGMHGALGNYYNWSAAIAANNSSSWTTSTLSNVANNPKNSICPAGWRLPTVSNASNSTAGSTNEFARLNYLYNSNKTNTDQGLFNGPLFLARAGDAYGGSVNNVGYDGYYWSSSVYSSSYAYRLSFSSSGVNPALSYYRYRGFSVRCVAR